MPENQLSYHTGFTNVSRY